jgi:two-component system LytT family response regulator
LHKLKIIIVDDEKRIRTSLIHVLKLHYPDAIVVAEAENILSAAEVIEQYKPDVILLDTKMPGGTGFDLLKQLMPLKFKIIFISAFDNYAVQAFKFSALDYLLKPIIPADLVKALDKASEKLNEENENLKLRTFVDNLKNENEKKIILNTQEATHVIPINEIIRCEADRNYTHFFLLNKKTILVSGGLKEYEEMLKPYGFIRPHHSHVINLAFITKLEKRTGMLILKDGSEVPVSIRKHPELIEVLNRF